MVDREEEEVKKMIILWKKQGKAGEGEGVILTRCGSARRLCPHPLLYYC
jgi:microcompartment protein CcmK/EutM